MTDLRIRLADWHQDQDALRQIRETVFITEQSVPPELEWDAEDATAIHFLAFDGDYPIGTARLSADGHIARLSVLRDWRGLGIGDALLEAVIAEAERRDLGKQTLSAQVQAAPFYERHGFRIVSEEFIDAGIPHVEMCRHSQG